MFFKLVHWLTGVPHKQSFSIKSKFIWSYYSRFSWVLSLVLICFCCCCSTVPFRIKMSNSVYFILTTSFWSSWLLWLPLRSDWHVLIGFVVSIKVWDNLKKLEAKFQMEENETMQFKVKIWQVIKDGKETYLLRIHISLYFLF